MTWHFRPQARSATLEGTILPMQLIVIGIVLALLVMLVMSDSEKSPPS